MAVPDVTRPADGQHVSDTKVGRDLTQIGSARDVFIGAHLSARRPCRMRSPPLPRPG